LAVAQECTVVMAEQEDLAAELDMDHLLEEQEQLVKDTQEDQLQGQEILTTQAAAEAEQEELEQA
jgi:hypothetical protein